MLFDLAALYLIVWMFKNAAMDLMYAGNGKPNPRWELKKAKAKAAGQPDPVQHRYGSRDWFADLLSDGLQAQTDWRRRKAEQKRKAREAAEAEAAEAEQAEAEQTEAEPDGADDEPQSQPDPDPQSQSGPEPQPEPEPGPRPGPAGSAGENRRWGWVCQRPGCPGQGFGYDSELTAGAAARRHVCVNPTAGGGTEVFEGEPPQASGPAAGGAPDPEQQQSPRPSAPPDSRPSAKVIPFPNNNAQEEPVSTDVNTEVIGLDQSIGYARNLAAFAGEHGQAGNEGYIGHLTTAKITGQALSTAHEMQAAFGAAAEAAQAHAVELEKQKAVQEAYDNNADAGDKAFQTEGR